MSLSSGFMQGLSTPVPVAGAGLPDDMTLYAGGPLDPLKEHEAKYKQLDRRRRMSERQSAKLLAELEKAKHQYYGDRDESDMDKVSFISSHPLLRRQYLLKMAQEPEPMPQESLEPQSSEGRYLGSGSGAPEPAYMSRAPEPALAQQEDDSTFNRFTVKNIGRESKERPLASPMRPLAPPLSPLGSPRQPQAPLVGPPASPAESQQGSPAPTRTIINPLAPPGATSPIRTGYKFPDPSQVTKEQYNTRDINISLSPQEEARIFENQLAELKKRYPNDQDGILEREQRELREFDRLEQREQKQREQGDYQFTDEDLGNVQRAQQEVTRREREQQLREQQLREQQQREQDEHTARLEAEYQEELRRRRWREQEVAARNQRLEDKLFYTTDPTRLSPRDAADKRLEDKGVNNAYRRAQRMRSLSGAYQQELQGRPQKPQAPAPEPGYLDRARGFFSDVGDSLKGMGSRVVRQGTQGLQQLANYGLRNSEFLEGLVDDDEEARILASLAQGSTGKDRQMYLKQLEDFTKSRKAGEGGRTQEQLDNMRLLGADGYDALKIMHLKEQADKLGLDFKDDAVFEQMDKDYGQAFDMYYGRGDEAKRLGIRPLEDDSFGTMFSDARNRFNAFRRAKQERSPQAKAVTDPKTVAPKRTPFTPISTIPVENFSPDTVSYLQSELGDDVDISSPGALGNAISPYFRSPQKDTIDKGMRMLEYMAADLEPPQMNKILMTSFPESLNAGKAISGMTDDEAIAYVNNMSEDELYKLDKFTSFASRYIAPEYTQEAKPRPGNTSYRVPDADALGSTLLFNPQTGEFNREYIRNPFAKAPEDLPPRYNEALREAMRRAEERFLPTAGLYF